MRGRLCGVILALVAGLAAGCGASHASAGSLSAAIAKTAATTSRVAVSTTMSSPGTTTTTITAVGEFDYAHPRGVLRLGGLGLGGEEVRYLPPRVYVKLPDVPGVPFLKRKAWLGISLPNRAAGVPFLPLGGVSANPMDLLSALTMIGSKVTDLGPATVRGVAVTHYRVNVDLAKAEAHQRPQTRAEFHSFVSSVGLATLRVDAWVDGQARVRRIAVSLPTPQSSGLPAGFRISETADYYDFGIPVQVSAPPAREVLSAGAFSQSISSGGSSSGGGFGQASPPPASGALSASQASAAEQAVRTFWAALSANSARAVERSVVPSQRSCIAGFMHATKFRFRISSLRITSAKPAGAGKATVWFSVKATVRIGGQTVPLSPSGAAGTNWLLAAEVSGVWYTDLSDGGSGILPPCWGPRRLSTTPLGMMIWLAGLAALRSGFLVSLVSQPGLNPAFAVPFLLAHDLPHHGNLAVLVYHVRVVVCWAAGTAWRRFLLTHDQILLHAGSWLSTRLTHYPRHRRTAHAIPPQPDRADARMGDCGHDLLRRC